MPGRYEESATRRADSLDLELTLLHRDSGKRFIVRPGFSVGRHDATGGAEVKLADFPGYEEIHRQHCRFERRGTAWYIMPFSQRDFRGPNAFTNRTYVNGVFVPPNTLEPVKSGDTITLSGVALTVLLP